MRAIFNSYKWLGKLWTVSLKVCWVQFQMVCIGRNIYQRSFIVYLMYRLVKINAAEGNCRSFHEGLEGEKMIEEYKDLNMAICLWDLPRWLLRKVLDKRRSFLLGCARKFESICISLFLSFLSTSHQFNRFVTFATHGRSVGDICLGYLAADGRFDFYAQPMV
jgi:hypothetical protein